MRLSENTRKAILAEAKAYPKPRTALLPALRLAQEEHGYLSVEVLRELGDLLDVDPNALYNLASFYSLLYLEPVGKCVLGLCNNLSCYLNGADRILRHVEHRLGIGLDETTPDGLFTLKLAECIGACDHAPAMMVGEEHYADLTEERVDQILEVLRARHLAGQKLPKNGRHG